MELFQNVRDKTVVRFNSYASIDYHTVEFT